MQADHIGASWPYQNVVGRFGRFQRWLRGWSLSRQGMSRRNNRQMATKVRNANRPFLISGTVKRREELLAY